MNPGKAGRAIAFLIILLLAQLPAIPAGKGETSEREVSEPEFSILLPHTALPGELIALSIRSSAPLTDPCAKLFDQNGTMLSRTEGFSDDQDRFIILVPLSSTLTEGNYKIVAEAMINGRTIISISTLPIGAVIFQSETIDFDAANSAIKNDLGPERLAQIKALNELLFRQNPDAPRFAGPFVLPLTSTRRTAHFGDRRTYRYSSGKTERTIHSGVDFGVPVGTPVFASGDGQVVMAEKRISTGWTVVIEHLPGLYSLYYHLDALTTTVGEAVRAGTLIGRSGATGLATGPHLHWEFRLNGESLAPDFFTGRILY